MFKPMQEARVKSEVITYSSLPNARANGGKTEEALDVFGSLQAARVKPNVITYSSLINDCAKEGSHGRRWRSSKECSMYGAKHDYLQVVDDRFRKRSPELQKAELIA